MEPVLAQLLPMLTAIWWPFCRILAMFIGAPVLGEAVTPVTVRILIALVLAVLSIIVFFAIDGHLLIANIIGQSFRAWPLGQGYAPLLLNAVAYNVAWIFSAAMLLAIPIVFSTLVVQLGFGFLNRVAPSLN